MNWSAEILFYCPDNMRPSLVLWQQKDDAILGIAIGVLSAKSFYKNR
jgi:bifunctional DNase/RNase